MPAYQPFELHALFAEEFNRGDVDALLALYEPTATLVVGEEHVTGAERLRDALETWLTRRGRMTVATRAVIESQDGLAILHGAWVVEPTTDTDAVGMTQGVSTEVVRRQPDGSWRFMIDRPNTPVL